MEAIDPEEHGAEVERWRAARLRALTAPDGWLSVVGLAWLRRGDNVVGTEGSGDVVLPGGPGRVGTIRVERHRATFLPEPGVPVTHGGAPVTTPLLLRDDLDGSPTVLQAGGSSFFVIRREGELAVRVRDADSAARRRFTGIPHYPVDARWRVDAGFEPFDPPRRRVVPTVLGTAETYVVPGTLRFEVEGRRLRLEAFLERGETDLFVVFADRTNEDETYPGGRFVYCRPPGDRGSVVLDFNQAYNPPCAFTPYAVCPLPPDENRLPLRVEAGEKRYRAR